MFQNRTLYMLDNITILNRMNMGYIYKSGWKKLFIFRQLEGYGQKMDGPKKWAEILPLYYQVQIYIILVVNHNLQYKRGHIYIHRHSRLCMHTHTAYPYKHLKKTETELADIDEVTIYPHCQQSCRLPLNPLPLFLYKLFSPSETQMPKHQLC